MFGETNENLSESTHSTLKNEIRTFLIGWLGMQIIGFFVDLGFTLVAILTSSNSNFDNFIQSSAYNMIFSTIIYFIVFVILALLNKNYLLSILKLDLNVNLKALIAGVACLLAIMAFSFIYNLLINLFEIDMSVNINEEGIKEATNSLPALSIITFGFIGPICEELTYRVGLFSAIKRKNKIIAFCATTIIFAFIHFNFEAITYYSDGAKAILINELLNIPTYLFAGFALTYTFDKYGFVGSATAHILNNLLSVLVQIFG